MSHLLQSQFIITWITDFSPKFDPAIGYDCTRRTHKKHSKNQNFSKYDNAIPAPGERNKRIIQTDVSAPLSPQPPIHPDTVHRVRQAKRNFNRPASFREQPQIRTTPWPPSSTSPSSGTNTINLFCQSYKHFTIINYDS